MEEDKAKLEAANADLKRNSTELLARAHALEQSLSEAQARAAEPRTPQLRLLDCRQGVLNPTVLAVLPVQMSHGVSPVPAQMWQQQAQSRRRCGTPRYAGDTRAVRR
jgi:hypothetical protein